MKVPKILENEFKSLKLKRIRLKTDPANPVGGYEGYFLQENEDGTIKMFVIGATQPYMDINPSDIDIEQSLTTLEKFKLMLATTVKDKTILPQIKNLNSINDIEAMLLSNGYTYEDLYTLLKNFFCTCDQPETFTEGVLGSMYRGTKKALSAVGRGWENVKGNVKKAEEFSKGNYGAFSEPKEEKPQSEKKPGLEPITVDGEKEQTGIYTKTKFDLDEPMPIDTLNWYIRLSSDRINATFTLKDDLSYGEKEGSKLYAPGVLEVFTPGTYFTGQLVTATSKGAPIKMKRGHYFIKPSTIVPASEPVATPTTMVDIPTPTFTTPPATTAPAASTTTT